MNRTALPALTAGKKVLIISTQRNFCRYTYDILLETGRYAYSHEMIEHSCALAGIRLLCIHIQLLFKNLENYDSVIICTEQKHPSLTRYRKFRGKEVVCADSKGNIIMKA